MLLNRKLLKLNFIEGDFKMQNNKKVYNSFKSKGISPSDLSEYLFFRGSETSKNYELENEILIQSKSGKIKKLSSFGSVFLTVESTTMRFFCYPKSSRLNI